MTTKRGASDACLGTGTVPSPKIAGTAGPRHWSMARDEKGYRDYKIKYRVQVGVLDGPHIALYTTPGLPSPGSMWNIDNDKDVWAFCTQLATVTPVAKEGEPNEFFDIEQTFSTKPAILCTDQADEFDNPLFRADIVSGSFVKYTREASFDANGYPVLSSSWEQLRGPQVEFDENRPQVRVQQNVADLDLPGLSALIDSVNLYPMWGFAAGTVKFSGCSWEKHYHVDCSIYYTRVLEFDINVLGFERKVLDEGTKALPGHYDTATGNYVIDLAAAATYSMTRTSGSNSLVLVGAGGTKIVAGQLVQGEGIPAGTTVLSVLLPTVTLSTNATSSGTNNVKFGVTANANNPLHFERFRDKSGNITRVILNGHGKPWDPDHSTDGTDDDTPGKIFIQYYPYLDFSTLALPSTL